MEPQTPRKHKAVKALGLKVVSANPSKIANIIRKRLKLDFEPEVWQATVIRKIVEGYDCILIAGTSYGKSLIFEGVAALERDKCFIVICPLKVLELDQLNEAVHKGLKAAVINEDTLRANHGLLNSVRKEKFNLIYISPELAVGINSPFTSLWKDEHFIGRLGGIIIDEAHCVHEWGQDFRKEYSELKGLRHFTGYNIPIIACSATMSTETFNVIWESLQFGQRPFWGLDVGTIRPNLFYTIREIISPTKLLYHVLNVLPQDLSINVSPLEIPKTLIYLGTPNLCGTFVHEFRKCLPESLRNCIRFFSAGISEKAKEVMWGDFKSGKLRILVSTEATALGCNDKEISHCFCVLSGQDPRSLSVLIQRWGRAGRTRSGKGYCFLFVPPWSFRPEKQCAPVLEKLKGRAQLQEPKGHTTSRNKLSKPLEILINLKDEGLPKNDICIHKYLARYFRPDTDLDILDSLDATAPVKRGKRSLESLNVSLTWTILDIRTNLDKDFCCYLCNPQLADQLIRTTDSSDIRLTMFARDFLYPLEGAAPVERCSSQTSKGTSSTVMTRRSNQAFSISKEVKADLHQALEKWCHELYISRGSGCLTTAALYFPSKYIDIIEDKANLWLNNTIINKGLIETVIKWNMGKTEDFESLAQVLTEWKIRASLALVPPASGRGDKKRTKTAKESVTKDIRGGESPSKSMPLNLGNYIGPICYPPTPPSSFPSFSATPPPPQPMWTSTTFYTSPAPLPYAPVMAQPLQMSSHIYFPPPPFAFPHFTPPPTPYYSYAPHSQARGPANMPSNSRPHPLSNSITPKHDKHIR